MAVSGNTIAHENLADQNAVDWRRQFQRMLGYDFVAAAGIGSGGVARSGDCAVTQRGAGANMSVDVAAGFVAAGPNSGGTGYDATAGVWTGFNDAVLNVVISAADATNPRIDLIGFGIRDTAYAGATDDGQITVITGTPAGVPVAPSIPATYIAWVDLAEVAVAALAASITNANITDRRRRLSALGGITVCTSTTRPATNPWEGQAIYETDTNYLLVYDGASWLPPVSGASHAESVNTALTAGTTTSATYVDIPGTSVTMSFTKRHADTDLIITGSLNGFYNTSTGHDRLGVNVNSVDYDLAVVGLAASVRESLTGTSAAITGLAAQAWTIKLRIKTTTGTITTDTYGRGSILVVETD